MQKSS